MMYIKDQYGNEIELNPTFKFVGLPFQREYSSMTKSGLDGEIITSKPIMNSVNRSITGQLYGSTKEEVLTKRNELADFCSLGEIRVGYSEEGWYIKGQVTSFDHKYIERSARYVADVSFTIKCDTPYQKADEVTEEWVVTPTNYPERIDMVNPHPAANVKLGTFDVSTGTKISDENSWRTVADVPGYTGNGYLSSLEGGNGFSFLSFSDFALMVYQFSSSRRMKIFADGEMIKDLELIGESGFIPVEVKFDTKKVREIIVVQTEGYMSVDCIIPVPANLPVMQNPGTVSDYPILKIQSTDTEAMFSALGKKVGDAEHAFAYLFNYDTDLLLRPPSGFVETVSPTLYNDLQFLNGQMTGQAYTSSKGKYTGVVLKFNLKSPQSPYYNMTATEIKNHMQSILAELWGYARGTIEVGDPSFEAGVNGFGTNVATISQSVDWAKTGNNSLKIVSGGLSKWAYAVKNYGNQAGKKVKAKLEIYNPVTGGTVNSILAKWYDVTNDADLAKEYIDLALGEEGTYEIEAVIPSNCDNVGLYIYPSVGIAEPATIYIDDVTVTTNGVELYCWSGGWSHLATLDHTYDFPKLMRWESSSAGSSLPYYINDGEVYFLIKSKYPSDGISSSAVYIDHCRLGTTMNYTKLGSEAIVNYGGNLLENGWTEYYAEEGYGQASSPVNQSLFDHEGKKLVYPGQKVILSYEGWRDIEAVKNGIYPAILLLHYLKDGTYISYTASSILFAFSEANKWERATDETYLKDNPDMGIIKAYCYRITSSSLPGEIGIRNAFLAVGDKIIKIQPQDQRMLEFSEDVVLAKGDKITADAKLREIDKNGERLYQLINQSFKFLPMQIFGGLNHFKINHSGANLKIRMNYQPKWR